MLAAPLNRRRQIERFRGRETRRGQDFTQRRPAERERAGLVEYHGVHASGQFQGLAAANEYPRSRTAACPDDDCRGSREAHGARAGNHDDRYEGDERMRQPRLRSEREPDGEGGDADAQHDRDEDARDSIGQALDRRLGTLGAADHLHDLGQGGVAPDPSGAEEERPVAIHGPTDDLGAASLLAGDRLPGQHGFVDRRLAADHSSVDRHALAGPDPNEVSDPNVLERDVHFGAGSNDSCGTRLQADQRLDRSHRLALGPSFEIAARQDQSDDRGRAVEVGLRIDAGRSEQTGVECDEDAVAPGCRRADDDQRVHARGEMDCGAPGGPVETTTREELDGSCRPYQKPGHLLHGQRHARQIHHGHRECGDRQRNRGDQSQPAEASIAFGGLCIRLIDQTGSRTVGRCLGLADLVTGGFDRTRQFVHPGDLRQVANSRDFGGEVDVGLGHARRLAQVPLDPVHTRGAAHAVDRQLDLGGRIGRHGDARGDGGVGGWWHWRLHTPGEYTVASRIRQR